MERRMRGNSHVRCGGGENPESKFFPYGEVTTSKDYLFLSDGQTRAVRLIVIGIILVGFEAMLKLLGVLS